MNDAYFMCKALALARRGLYTAHPNPSVGCVIVRPDDHGGRIVGRGFHARAGGAHAEIAALHDAGAAARGATAYLTLEPCSHQGRTPPCSDALIEAGVARVVAAMRDPNPRVNGAGVAALAAAGVAVECGLLGDEAGRLNRGFVSRMTRGRPWVRVKSAISLDGRTALASGESAWISGEAARRDVQFWRARSGALVAGSGTVNHDDPRLNVRLTASDLGLGMGTGEVRQPLRVVIDGDLKTKPTANVYACAGKAVVAACRADGGRVRAFRERGVEVLAFDTDKRRVPLAALLETLAARFAINEVQVESGAVLAGALIEARLCDELLLYVAPHLLGHAGRGLARFDGIIESIGRREEFRYRDVRMMGNDLRILAEPCPR